MERVVDEHGGGLVVVLHDEQAKSCGLLRRLYGRGFEMVVECKKRAGIKYKRRSLFCCAVEGRPILRKSIATSEPPFGKSPMMDCRDAGAT